VTVSGMYIIFKILEGRFQPRGFLRKLENKQLRDQIPRFTHAADWLGERTWISIKDGKANSKK